MATKGRSSPARWMTRPEVELICPPSLAQSCSAFFISASSAAERKTVKLLPFPRSESCMFALLLPGAVQLDAVADRGVERLVLGGGLLLPLLRGTLDVH